MKGQLLQDQAEEKNHMFIPREIYISTAFTF